ncbi:MAG: hypothetical protein ACI81L_003614, partial [Verrucomicrobiales bacterium]
YRFYADKELGTSLMYNLGNPEQLPRGAFGAVIVEPAGATYRNPVDGTPVLSGVRADIILPDRSFREYVTLFQDEDSRIDSSVMPYNANVDGFSGINYRAEPLDQRLLTNPDRASVFDSDIHGDPATVFDAYVGDPVVFRVANATGEQVHTFAVEGHRFPWEPNIAGSEQLASKGIAPTESFDAYVIDGAGAGVTTGADYLLQNARMPFQRAGMWGIFRTHDAPQPDLLPLPNLCAGQQATVIIAEGDLPTNGDDVILGTANPDVINGLGGDDLICGVGGDDTINGAAGDDTIYGGDGADSLFGGFADAGQDVLFGGEGDDDLISGAGRDTLNGDGGNDTLNGGTGDDFMNGGAGNDAMFGQSGDDTMFGGEGDDRINGVDGKDTIDGGPGLDIINSGPDDDTVMGGADADVIFGLGGADQLHGDAGADTIFGQLGMDTIDGGSGDDLIWGNGHNDMITDPSGVNIINGGAGDDDITGGINDDVIFGDGNNLQAGNDMIDGGLGSDQLFGFAGSDTIIANDGFPDLIRGGDNPVGDGDSCTIDPGIDTNVFFCEVLLN